MVVTALTVAVIAGPVVAGARVTLTLLGVIVPLGKLLPVTFRTVTPGWPALGETMGVRVTATGALPVLCARKSTDPVISEARITRRITLSRRAKS